MRLLLTLVVVAGSFAFLAAAEPGPLSSAVVSVEATTRENHPGSVIHGYFRGDTAGTRNTFAGVVVVEPGHELHPAHRHPDEEFLLIIEGEGRWLLNDRTFAAKAGDMLYVAPNDLHGIFNSGKVPLKFALWKWRGPDGTTPDPVRK
jgi:mannose-6-phosphate isomerase-like protein (cupin superfamily)